MDTCKSVAPNAAWAHKPFSLAELVVWPTVAYFYSLAVLHIGGGDEWIVSAFYDPQRHVFPLKHNFWTQTVVHDGGHELMLVVGIVLLGFLLTTMWIQRWRHLRRPLAFIVLSMAACVITINLGKQVTNMDCPWDLTEFGGQRVHYTLLQDKPDEAPRGHCFPGGHSSSGFALFALFFVARCYGYRRPSIALLPAFAIGGSFALDQWARGAHFPSHDLTTAYVCWMIALAVYWRLYAREPRAEPPVNKAPSEFDDDQ